MRDEHVRGLILFTLLGIAGCSSASSPSSSGGDGTYLNDAAFRRHELELSLVNPSNGYGTRRLAHYDSGDANDWSLLPISNPRATPLGVDGKPTGTPVSIDLADPNLGEDAFFRYPIETISDEYRDPKIAALAGMWSDATHGLGGLVDVEYDGGSHATALTCASCHAREDGGKLTIGVGNSDLSLGWGPGRIDVTTTVGAEPVVISDIRATRFLTHLHHDANVELRDETTLAIRIETLIITQRAENLRPPREVAWALADYVWKLADTLPPPPQGNSDGAAVFAANCASCHLPEKGFAGPPVPIAVAGTDPTLGLSRERGTGNYRVPSLRGVGQRGALLHDASVRSLDAFMDPARSGGHDFGLQLDEASRAALVDYLRSL